MWWEPPPVGQKGISVKLIFNSGAPERICPPEEDPPRAETILFFVPEKGLEPPCLAASAPKADASTTSATPATSNFSLFYALFGHQARFDKKPI